MKAIVTGMIATFPLGGVAWDYVQYAVGLERLGFEVYYLEDTGWVTYSPIEKQLVEEPTYGIEFLRQTLSMFSPSLANRWHLRAMNGRTFGMDTESFSRIAREAELFLNVSGGTLMRDEYLGCARKVMIDTDPGLNQFVLFPRQDAAEPWPGGKNYRAHDFFFSFAERIGKEDCILPSLGIQWRPTRQPVLLDSWCPRGPATSWTTVMSWKSLLEVLE